MRKRKCNVAAAAAPSTLLPYRPQAPSPFQHEQQRSIGRTCCHRSRSARSWLALGHRRYSSFRTAASSQAGRAPPTESPAGSPAARGLKRPRITVLGGGVIGLSAATVRLLCCRVSFEAEPQPHPDRCARRRAAIVAPAAQSTACVACASYFAQAALAIHPCT